MLEKIKKMIESGKLDESILNEIKTLEDNNNVLKKEISKLEAMNLDIKESRDKVKSVNKIFKTKLGISDDEEITEEVINTKFKTNSTDNTSKNEITNLENILKEMKQKYEQELNNTKNEIFGRDIQLELLKNGTKIKAASKVAMDLIMENLKKDATIEDGKIIYKNKDGEVLRKDGIPVSIDDRISELKQNEDYSCFFISEAQSGSGMQTKTSGADANNRNLTPAAQMMAKKALELGIPI